MDSLADGVLADAILISPAHQYREGKGSSKGTETKDACQRLKLHHCLMNKQLKLKCLQY